MQVIDSTSSHGPVGNGHAVGHAEQRGGATTPRSAPTTEDAPAVHVTLSEEADELLNSATTSQAPGKSGDSTAHRARAARSEFAGLHAMPFGNVVSAIARGIDPQSLLAPAGETDDAPVGDGDETDPA